jgi:hypothetical protein
MADDEVTPKAPQISVDIKEANEAFSESQTTPTPSKLNANAVEFVPGQFKSSTTTSTTSSLQNTAAPVFTPQFQMTANGFVPMSTYGVPYYMYVPTNGAGAPMAATNPDGSVSVSPILSYQPVGGFNASAMPFQPMNGRGLSRHASSGSRASGKGGYKGVNRGPKPGPTAEPIPVVDTVVVKEEDFPSMLGSAIVPKPESPKSSWAAIAKKPGPIEKSPVVACKQETTISTVESPTPVVDETNTITAVTVETTAEEFPSIVEETRITKASSVRSEPPTEPTPRTVPVTTKAKLAPWAASVSAPEEEQNMAPQAEIAEEVCPPDDATDKPVVEVVEKQLVEEAAEVVEIVSSGSVTPRVTSIEYKTYAIDVLRRLRFHDACKPSAEIRSLIPHAILKPRGAMSGASAEEADDWRAEAAAANTTRRTRSNNRLERRASSRIEILPEMLIPSENSWSVAQQNKDATIDENVKVGRKIFAILNKLTVEKFNKLADQLFTDCGISKPAHIITLVKYLFEKATIQHHFIGMYADLCNRCLDWLGSDRAPEELINSIGPGERSTAAADIFRRVLLERCQQSFYSYFLTPEEDDEGAEKSEEEHHKHRLSMLGTVKFVAQLLERRLMTRGVFRNCLDTLLYSDERTEDHIECACVFLTEVGQLFEKDEGEDPDVYSRALNEAMETLEDIANDDETSARIKFTIMNLIDLRNNRYIANRLPGQPLGPAKISEIHKLAAKEENLTRTLSRAHNSSSHSLVPQLSNPGVDDWETVPSKRMNSLPGGGLPPTPTKPSSGGVLARSESTWKKIGRSDSSDRSD